MRIAHHPARDRSPLVPHPLDESEPVDRPTPHFRSDPDHASRADLAEDLRSRNSRDNTAPARRSRRPTPASPIHSKQALADLEQLIGLDRVKQEITTLTNYLNLQQHRQEASLPVQQLSLHMVFQGNPGTGKTTVARIVGRIFKSLGLLKRGHLVETDRAGMVAEYAGQTAPKTHRKIDEALDGILFIDEAYSLVASGQEDAYGHEAVQALVKRMEDDRHRLVVIIAGYPEPIDQLLHSNPGLSSRFNTQLLVRRLLSRRTWHASSSSCARRTTTNCPAWPAPNCCSGFQWLYDCPGRTFRQRPTGPQHVRELGPPPGQSSRQRGPR